MADNTSLLHELADDLLKAITANDSQTTFYLTPIVLAEALAVGTPARFLFQTCKNFVLDPSNAQPTDFQGRLKIYLRHDVGGRARSTPPPPEDHTDAMREVFAAQQGMFDEPISVSRHPGRKQEVTTGLPVAAQGAQQLLAMDSTLLVNPREHPHRLFVSVVEKRLNAKRMELAAAKIRSALPGWLAILRVAFPDYDFGVSKRTQLHATSGRIQNTGSPDHRRFYTRRMGAINLEQLSKQLDESERRACLYWLSLAYSVWPESAAHAAAMTWMAIESLLGEKCTVENAATRYLAQLPSQLALEIEETHNGLRRDATTREGGFQPPRWAIRVAPRKSFPSDEDWLLALMDELATEEPLLEQVISNVLDISENGPSQRQCVQVKGDLDMLRCARHAIAHTGFAAIEEGVGHYLATFGAEVIRAALDTTG